MPNYIVQKSKPQNLYRYIKIDKYIDSILLDNKLHFSNPAMFNDPLELQVKFIFSGKEEDYSNFKRHRENTTWKVGHPLNWNSDIRIKRETVAAEEILMHLVKIFCLRSPVYIWHRPVLG